MYATDRSACNPSEVRRRQGGERQGKRDQRWQGTKNGGRQGHRGSVWKDRRQEIQESKKGRLEMRVTDGEGVTGKAKMQVWPWKWQQGRS